MTTYAKPTTQPAPPYGPPPAAPPNYAGRSPVMPPRRRPRRTGIVAATGALAIAVAATAAAMITLTKPVTPAQHTIDVVPPPPMTYSSTEIQAAKDAACSAWDKAARSTAVASKSSAASLAQSWQSPESAAALAAEKRAGMSSVAYLRTELGAATPANVATPLEDWMTARVDMLHALNMRDWSEADRVQQRSNNLVDPIVAVCGLG
jgi:hypothetical protein